MKNDGFGGIYGRRGRKTAHTLTPKGASRTRRPHQRPNPEAKRSAEVGAIFFGQKFLTLEPSSFSAPFLSRWKDFSVFGHLVQER
ncbi:hypothetical protein MTP99_005222 [Tenebrio molitor]|nr:hypothetical protein MTP99_005222 [Tenebrio molitor]